MAFANERTPGAGYVLDNAAPESVIRMDMLSKLFDGGTIRHLEARGVSEGWTCLEVGGGGGSIAAWLCARVGAAGRVLATDIDTRFLDALDLPGLEVRRHDIATDPLPESAFDLVHARLVLMHLPERELVLQRLVAALKPGGWLLLEDFDTLALAAEPEVNPAEVRLKAFPALQRVMNERGVDLRFGRRLPGLLVAHGLDEVGAEGRVLWWRGGSYGARMSCANFEQLREALVRTGLISDGEIESELARLDDPSFAAPSPILWTTWGRRPSSAG